LPHAAPIVTATTANDHRKHRHDDMDSSIR
jgi:hypothetical protein